MINFLSVRLTQAINLGRLNSAFGDPIGDFNGSSVSAGFALGALYEFDDAFRVGVAYRSRMPSRPGEFHPEPLTDPDLTLSRHPARAIARKLPPSIEHSGSSRDDPVDPGSTAMACSLRSTGITPLPRYYGAVRP